MEKAHHKKATIEESGLAQPAMLAAPPARKVTSEEIFDNLSRSMAGMVSRREVLKMAITGFATMALSKLGIKSAWAGSCLCNGVIPFDPSYQCCTPGGVVAKHPITDLNKCAATLVPSSSFSCNPKGCADLFGPPVFNFAFKFYDSDCNSLYCCLATCQSNASICGVNFTTSINPSLTCAHLLLGITSPKGFAEYALCMIAGDYLRKMNVYVGFTMIHERLQKLGCDCCNSQNCSCTEPNHTCASINDLYPSCCTAYQGCWMGSSGHAKCCDNSGSAFADSFGNVHCCPPKTFGYNTDYGFSCEQCDSDLGRGIAAAFCSRYS